MIWVAWRQHRKQALIEAGVIAAAALLLLLSGYQMLHVFKSSGLAKCLATAGADCGDLRDSFTNHYNGYQFMIPLFLLAPVLFGMFFGAPLVAREIENGTHRLAWTQGVTRTRWLVVKLVLVVVPLLLVAAVVGILEIILIDQQGTGANHWALFDQQAPMTIAATLFGLALG